MRNRFFSRIEASALNSATFAIDLPNWLIPLSGPFPPEASCPAAVKGMLSFSFLVIESRLAMIKTFYSTPFRCLFSAA